MSYIRHKNQIDVNRALWSNPTMRHASPTFSPLYRQIKSLLTHSLQTGEWKPAEAIPSEMELASRYQVSQGTVRKAIDELAAENLLTRRQGKGTFVATHHEPKNLFRFLRLMPDAGEPEYPASRLLECSRGRASAEVARALGLKNGAAVVLLRRLLIFSGKPTVIDEVWLPGALFRKLTAEIFDEYKGSLYGLFESEFGVRMIRAEEKIRAVAANVAEAALLGIAEGVPLLLVERLTFTYGDKPVELRRGLYLTEQHYYRNELF
jgi:GntR family transcriptional regulator